MNQLIFPRHSKSFYQIRKAKLNYIKEDEMLFYKDKSVKPFLYFPNLKF
jgi:hypothetical protein